MDLVNHSSDGPHIGLRCEKNESKSQHWMELSASRSFWIQSPTHKMETEFQKIWGNGPNGRMTDASFNSADIP